MDWGKIYSPADTDPVCCGEERTTKIKNKLIYFLNDNVSSALIHAFAAYFHRLRVYGLKDIRLIYCSAL